MILIVDDDPIFLENARKVLNRERRVFWAGTSKQALQLAQDLGFSVVLVDLDLRGEDSLDLIRTIRGNFPGLPVIGMSSTPETELVKFAKDLGAVEILHKPVTPEWKPVVERVRAMAARA